MGTADEDEIQEGGARSQPDHPDEEGAVSDEGGDSDPGAASDDDADGAATGEAQAAENRDRESPS
ncbi:hypothetical protein KSP35_21570 [Aquihabitans sp. G128]|uniref:hypothetical protein n=1 Tax=Aquihabitans sp. G128 TaxID=2849779 RepID=UPI001C23793E|nr:hypothetical protein [Aquihabitans sp. G128]QXC60878.1 hypothetical protein KSP35_21570 [Aquihabitans sp. G128]